MTSPPSPAKDKGRLLIVDDESSIRWVFQRIFSNAGYEVELAATADEALKILEDGGIDVALVDIHMPYRSGMEVLVAIREKSYGTLAILMTGFPEVDSAAEAMRVGAVDYLAKPVSGDAALLAVSGAMRQKRLEDANALYRDHLEQLVAERTGELERSRDQLRRSEELMRTILRTLPLGVCLIGPDWQVEFANRKFHETFGLENPAEPIRFPNLCLDPSQFQELRRTVETMRERVWIERTILRMNGAGNAPVWVEVSLVSDNSDEANPRLVAAITDVTRQRDAEQARREAERQLEEQRVLRARSDRLRSLGEMAAGIAHELNQPLVGVRGSAEHLLIAMERQWQMKQEEVVSKLNLIIDQSDRMSHIIDHVRTFARDAGKPQVQPVDLNSVANSAANLLSAQFRSRGLSLELELAPDLPPIVANPYSLEEVVLNLLINARDAVEDAIEREKGHCDGRVTLETGELPNGCLALRVRDRGPGIPAEDLSRVFDPFFTTKGPDRGTGLGLAISRSIIEQFGGTLEVRSEPGVETVASVQLPAITAESESS